MRILVSTSSLFPYRVDWLDELAKFADIDIFYLQDDDPDRVTEWCAKRPKNCSYTLMNCKKIPFLGLRTTDFIKVLKHRLNEYDFVILDGYGYYTQLLNIKYLNRHKIDYYVNVDGIVPKEKENWFIKALKKRIISKIPHFMCGSIASNQLLIQYGSKPERIINHPFTSLHKSDILSEPVDSELKKELKKKLGISEEIAIISVGRFSYLNGYGKGYDALINAAQKLEKYDIGWYIVGGKPTNEFETIIKTKQIKSVHFIDFLDKSTLFDYYRASDIFVLMTISDVWGLVVNEAMANGLPVITTNKCVAGLDLVTNGVNGYLVDVGDSDSLSKLVIELLEEDIRNKMGLESLKRIRKYTIEDIGLIHKKYFEELYNAKRKD